MPKQLYCPACDANIQPSDTNHRKVSGLLSESIHSDTTMRRYQSGLATKLMPPKTGNFWNPDKEGKVHVPGCSRILVILFGLCFSLPLLILGVISGNLEIIFAGLFVIGLATWRYITIPKIEEKMTAKAAAYMKAHKIWESSYYCQLHDTVFSNEAEMSVHSNQFQQCLKDVCEN
jgi:hypothetical protein